MPVYLAPWSRRRFLAATLTAAASLLTGSETLARSRQRNANAFALLSDLHIDADPVRVARGIKMSEHLGTIVRELQTCAAPPAEVMISGDLACSSGQPGDYRQLARLLAPLSAAGYPLRLALGNHDHRNQFWAEFQNEQAGKRPLSDRQTMLVSSPNANWFILDSLDKTNITPGMIGVHQLKWLADTLDANSDKPAIIVLHHNPGLQENMGLKDTGPLYDVIRHRRQVKAYVYGHTHKWKTLQDTSGIHLINLPAASYVFQDDDPAGWVLAQVRPDSMRLELRCIDQAHRSHGEVKNLVWRS